MTAFILLAIAGVLVILAVLVLIAFAGSGEL